MLRLTGPELRIKLKSRLPHVNGGDVKQMYCKGKAKMNMESLNAELLNDKYQARKDTFEAATAKVAEQEERLVHLATTIIQTEKELKKLERDKETAYSLDIEADEIRDLLMAIAVATDKLKFLQEERSRTQITLLGCRYNAAVAANAYADIDDRARENAFKQVLPDVLAEMKPTLLLVRGLCDLFHQPLYVVKQEITKILEEADENECIEKITGHLKESKASGLPFASCCLEKRPHSVRTALLSAPSPSQWQLAQNSPDKMRELAEGKVDCRGWRDM